MFKHSTITQTRDSIELLHWRPALIWSLLLDLMEKYIPTETNNTRFYELVSKPNDLIETIQSRIKKEDEEAMAKVLSHKPIALKQIACMIPSAKLEEIKTSNSKISRERLLEDAIVS